LLFVAAVEGADVPLDGVFQSRLAAGRNHPVEKMSVDGIEGERRKRSTYRRDLLRRQRDEIGIAAHEAQKLAVGGHRGNVGRAQYTAAAGALCPVQHGTAGKVSAAADQR